MTEENTKLLELISTKLSKNPDSKKFMKMLENMNRNIKSIETNTLQELNHKEDEHQEILTERSRQIKTLRDKMGSIKKVLKFYSFLPNLIF